MNKSGRINRVSAALYEENLPTALHEVTMYLIHAITFIGFEYEGVRANKTKILEDVERDFRAIRTDGIINPKDVLSIELSLLSCILNFVEKDVSKGRVSRKDIIPFIDMFISEIISLSTIHMIDISNDHIASEEFNKVGLIDTLKLYTTENITSDEVNILVLKIEEYQHKYDLLHIYRPTNTSLN